MNTTHDWHVGTDGMELIIARDEKDSVIVILGHESTVDAVSTVVITSRLLEMIDTVQPGAMRAYLAQQATTQSGPPSPCPTPNGNDQRKEA